MKIELVNFDIRGDDTGSLTVIEGNRHVPFPIKRVYYIYDTKPGIVRGHHAHKDLQQIAICISGSCRFVLDNGVERLSVALDQPTKGLIINEMVWREMHDFTPDCVLLVLASHYYSEDDYIRNYQDFLAEVKRKQ